MFQLFNMKKNSNETFLAILFSISIFLFVLGEIFLKRINTDSSFIITINYLFIPPMVFSIFRLLKESGLSSSTQRLLKFTIAFILSLYVFTTLGIDMIVPKILILVISSAITCFVCWRTQNKTT